MKNVLLVILSVFLLASTNAFATSDVSATKKEAEKSVEVKFKEGDLTLKDLIEACESIAVSAPSKLVNKAVPGTIIEMKGKKYEVRFFSFEDTAGKYPKDISFKVYAEDKGILGLPSVMMNPLPGINFQSFDYRRANLNDGVYFSMAVRLVEEDKK